MTQGAARFSAVAAVRLALVALKDGWAPFVLLGVAVLPLDIALSWLSAIADGPGPGPWGVRVAAHLGFLTLSNGVNLLMAAILIGVLRGDGPGLLSALRRTPLAFWPMLAMGLLIEAPDLATDHLLTPILSTGPAEPEIITLAMLVEVLEPFWDLLLVLAIGYPALAAADRGLGFVQAFRRSTALLAGQRWRFFWFVLLVQIGLWLADDVSSMIANGLPVDDESLAYVGVGQGLYSLAFLPAVALQVGAYIALSRAAGAREPEGAAEAFD